MLQRRPGLGPGRCEAADWGADPLTAAALARAPQ